MKQPTLYADAVVLVALVTRAGWGPLLLLLSAMTTTNDHVIVVLKAETYLKVLFFNKVEDENEKWMVGFYFDYWVTRQQPRATTAPSYSLLLNHWCQINLVKGPCTI